MRILIATEHLRIVGGAENYLQSLIPALTDHRHTVGLVHGDSASFEGPTIDLQNQCARWSLSDLGLSSLVDIVADWRPDVVYAHGLRSAALESSLLASYPAVLFAHGYYGTCGTGAKTHKFPIIRPCSRKFGAMCLMLHLPRRCGGLNPVTAWRYYDLQSQRRDFLPRYGAVLVASRHMREEFCRHGVRCDRLHLAPLPISNLSPDTDAPLWRVPQGRILYLGRLSELKGLSYLFSAIPTVAQLLGLPIRLTVAGSGPEEDHFRDLARRLQLEVEFAGWVDNARKLGMLRQTDLLAVPSLWPEPFGLVGLEAACLGVPAVAFAVGGIPDWLVPGKSGELACGDPPTVNALAQAIVRALNSREHYNRLCKGAWEKAHEFSTMQHVDRLESILADVSEQPFATDTNVKSD